MAKKKSASEEKLEMLHAAVAEYMINRLESSQEIDPDDPDDFAIPLASGEIANIINFLKMNNITACPTDAGLNKLKSEFAKNEEFQQLRDAKAAALVASTHDDDDNHMLYQ